MVWRRACAIALAAALLACAGDTGGDAPDPGGEALVPDAAVGVDLPGADQPPDQAQADSPLEAVEEIRTPEVADTSPPDSAPDAGEVADASPGDAEVADTPEALDASPVDTGPPVPPTLALTVNGLPETMNGSEPYLDDAGALTPFRLSLPPEGFTLDVSLVPGSGAVPPEGLRVRASVTVGSVPAGDDLGAWFTWTDETHATWRVPPQAAFAADPAVRVEAWAQADDGQTSPLAEIVFRVQQLAPHLDPFAAPDLWLLDTRRDLDTVTVTAVGGAYEVYATNTPEGTPDFAETLHAFGFLGPDEAFNQAFQARYRQAVRENLHKMFDLAPEGTITDESVRIRFVFDGEEGAPNPAAYADDGDFSMIAIGGDSFDAFGNPSGFFGRAWIDPNNQEQDDNTVPGNGVFFTALMRKVASFAALKPLLAPIVPPEGTPLGGREGDQALLEPGYNPNADPDPVRRQRGVVLRLFLQVGGIGLAALTAHEIGHSLGLVAPGAPPAGLFGGVDQAAFVVGPADGWHIDTAGPNLMQSGSSLNIADFLTTYPRFNPMNMAYLKRRLVVDPAAVGPLSLGPSAPRPRVAIP